MGGFRANAFKFRTPSLAFVAATLAFCSSVKTLRFGFGLGLAAAFLGLRRGFALTLVALLTGLFFAAGFLAAGFFVTAFLAAGCLVAAGFLAVTVFGAAFFLGVVVVLPV